MFRLTDKAHNEYSLTSPGRFLSQRAIERRAKQKIPFSNSDLPVSKFYADSLTRLGFTITKTSKWLNAVCIPIADTSQFALLRKLNFIRLGNTKSQTLKSQSAYEQKFIENFKPIDTLTTGYYGESVYQTAIHNGPYLHKLGYKGQNMLVAVLDAGFLNASSIDALDSVYAEKRIVGTRDFVTPGGNVYKTDSHGTMVLSAMAGLVPGVFIGTSPGARFLLFRTEDSNSEYPIEEFNWAMAAEVADSAGADVINTSLGYTVFNNATLNHTYADMDGNSTIVSKAADMAASKGILVVVSAGNEGSSTWHYIGAPADADSVLAVGAIDTSGHMATFSSYGPSYDRRVKPDVLAVGRNSVVATPYNYIAYSNGTSFSSPIMAGLVTCLWQAFPSCSNMDIINAVRRSSSLYLSPGTQTGYGIPDFTEAFRLLLATDTSGTTKNISLKCYPNPFSAKLYLYLPVTGNKEITIRISSLSGQVLFHSTYMLTYPATLEIPGLSFLSAGIYIVSVDAAGLSLREKVMKF
jgi:subtilisin family serine protease